MYSLKDKVAVITGSANGIGAQMVQEFLKDGAKFVAIVDIDEVAGLALERKLTAEYGKNTAAFIKCDITRDDELKGIFDTIYEDFGGIDIVVNNAGIATETSNKYKKLIEINLTATVSSTLKALELMREDRGGKGGTVINISSVGALQLLSPSVFIYSATKAAVLHFSMCMGMEQFHRHTNVRILTICFGITDTEILAKMESFDDFVNENIKKIKPVTDTQSPFQSANLAAQGLVQSYRSGKSGSAWLVDGGEVTDITDRLCQAYNIMSANINYSNLDKMS